MAAVDIVECGKRTEIEIVGQTPHPSCLGLRIEVFVIRLVVVVYIVIVAYTPEFCRHRREIDVVLHAAAVVGRYVGAAHAELEEHACGGIEVYRHIRRGEHRIGHVGAVETGRYKPDAEFRVGGIVRPSDKTYVEFLVFFRLVGIFEVLDYLSNQTLFGRHGVGRRLRERVCNVLC